MLSEFTIITRLQVKIIADVHKHACISMLKINNNNNEKEWMTENNYCGYSYGDICIVNDSTF